MKTRDRDIQAITITGAREHNLHDIDISIPLGKITIITGKSGSGKSTIAMDILFAEGQHRYLQSLGLNAGKTVKLRDRPDVDTVTYLPPPIALEQKRPSGRNAGSTVATLTGIKPLMRLLFAHTGTPYCPECHLPLHALTIDQIARRLSIYRPGTKLILLAPVTHLFQTMSFDHAVRMVREQGFIRIIIDGQQYYTDQPLTEPDRWQSVELVIDRLITKTDTGPRLTDSVRLALKAGNGVLKAKVIPAEHAGNNKIETITLTERLICERCLRAFPDLLPQHFSINKPTSVEIQENSLICGMKTTELLNFISTVELAGHTWNEIFHLPVIHISKWLQNTADLVKKTNAHHTGRHIEAALRLISAINSRLDPCIRMGLGYLSLSREAGTLSTGEIQRLRLGEQTGRSMSGILYIMDEPATGMHPSEHETLWQQIKKLQEAGNTMLVIEHDISLMARADHIIELGPGAGEQGGRVIFSGDPETLAESRETTITGAWLSGARNLQRKPLRPGNNGWIKFAGLSSNNIKDLSVSLPCGCLTCITGVSGSGKSSLAAAMVKTIKNPVQGKEFMDGNIHLPKAVVMDQSPLIRSRVSMPATYMGIFSHIRQLFARTPEARKRGLAAGWFSLAKKGGRCEQCRGTGYITTDLKILPPVESQCDLCMGKRYSMDALNITYKGMSLADLLDMSVNSAAGFFSRIRAIRRPLEWLERTGLGYLRMGQPTSTLSGGEAQRLKLAKELAKKTGERSFYMLDEPAMGLHLDDTARIMTIFDDLLEQDHTVVIAEHEPRIIAIADWIIDMGPGGGPKGGKIIFEGTPKELSGMPNSLTGRYIKKVLDEFRVDD